MSTPGGYYDECGGIMSTPGDVRYTGVSIQIQKRILEFIESRFKSIVLASRRG